MKPMYVHNWYGFYEKYGLDRAPKTREAIMTSSHNYGGNNPNQVAGDMIRKIKSMAKQTNSSNKEAQQLATFFNARNDIAQYGPQEATRGTEQARARFDIIKKTIEELLGVSLDENLALTEESENNLLKLKEKEVDLRRIKNKIETSAVQNSLARNKVNKIINKAKAIIENNKVSGENAEKFMKIYQEVDQVMNEIENRAFSNSTAVKEIRATQDESKMGYIINNNQAGRNFVRNLNKLNALISYSTVAQVMGEVGELFGTAGAAAYLTKQESISEELISDLVKSIYNNTNSAARIVGANKSATVYMDTSNSQGTIKGTKQAFNYSTDINLGEGSYFHFNATQDKVDAIINIEDRPPINFSIKNYNSTNKVTVLSGNIYPFFTEYPDFMYSYLNIMQNRERHKQWNGYKLDSEERTINLMKKAGHALVGWRSVAGGVLSLTNNNNIIHGKTADYFLFNDNSNGNVYVLSTAQVLEQIIRNPDLIKIEPGIGHGEMGSVVWPHGGDFDIKASLSWLQKSRKVYLRLNELLNSGIPNKN